MFATPCCSLSYELGVELSYPVPEGFSASMENFALKSAALVLVILSTPFTVYNIVDLILVIFFAAQSIAFSLIVIMDETFNRSEIEEKLTDR